MESLEKLYSRIEATISAWNSLNAIPEDLFGAVPEMTKTDVAVALGRNRIGIEGAISSNQRINPIYVQQISNQLTNIETYVNQHFPSNPSAHIVPFINLLYALNLAVDSAVVDVATENRKFSSAFTEKLRSRLSESISKAEIVNSLLSGAKELIEKNTFASAELAKAVLTSQESTSTIQERDRVTAEATSRITATENKSITLLTSLEESLDKIGISSSVIKRQQEDLSVISNTLQAKLTEAQNLLEDANRHGLAGAFKTRNEDLRLPALGWIALFLLSILGLSVLAVDALNHLDSNWQLFLLRIPLSAPLVWLGWFSAKQYGFTRRIQEDYSFKVAAAMSFQGYRNEVNTDEEMVRLLRQSAITNFSANPIRIYEDSKNHGTPIHELLANLPEEKFKKITELIKLLMPAKP